MEYSAVVSFIPARMLFILPPVLALFHLLCYSLIVIYRSSHPSWWGLFLYIIFCCLSYMSQSYIHPPNHLGPLLQIQYLIYPISFFLPLIMQFRYPLLHPTRLARSSCVILMSISLFLIKFP